MSSQSRKRPGEDAIAKVLDWVGLGFGIGVLVLLTNFTLSSV
jgi:hypothetical protein